MNSVAPDENNILFWKQKYEELNIQFDEYQTIRADIEQELESELKQCQDEIKDLKNRNMRLTIENDNLKSKLNEINTTTHKQISKLQDELAETRAVKDERLKRIRELEQKNDDLERTYRCTMFSLEDFENKLNEALERNAILESELDEKDELAETVQRLRDEARDLKQELAVRQIKAQKEASTNKSTTSSTNNSTLLKSDDNNNTNNSNHNLNNSSNTQCPMETDSSSPQPNDSNDQVPLNTILHDLNLQQQISNKIPKTLNGDLNTTNNKHNNIHPVTPALRISALNYVGDAIRKITSVESRLIASRNLMKESNRDRRSATISSIESTRTNKEENEESSMNGSMIPTNSKLLKKDDTN